MESQSSFATLTHARVRADQGDVGGAVRILRVILAVQPAHREAAELLAELEQRRRAPARSSPSSKIRRLSDWLARVQRSRDVDRVR